MRLFAFACWNDKLIAPEDVYNFLESISLHAFWRWALFPEIASARAVRWNDLSENSRSRLEFKLLNGPTSDAFLSDHVPEVAVQFHKVHELARLVDNNCSVSEAVRRIVEDRRKEDSNFPRHVPAIEPGLEGPQVRWAPQGKPDKFANIPSDRLLETLVTAPRDFHDGDHAEAFAQTLDGKYRLLEVLTSVREDAEFLDEGWKLLLSYPHNKTEDTERLPQIAEGTARAALSLSAGKFENLSDQLCYWLNATEELCPKFAGADKLWVALLPYAVVQANDRTRSKGWSDGEVDLTMAALNEPLGHLLSIFLRRCPIMPTVEEDRPPLPTEFAEPLKSLTGRARELVANRMAVIMHYFVRADRRWLDEFVLLPMREDSPESDRLWEAYAKYSKIMPPSIWGQLQELVFRRLASARLSPEARI